MGTTGDEICNLKDFLTNAVQLQIQLEALFNGVSQDLADKLIAVLNRIEYDKAALSFPQLETLTIKGIGELKLLITAEHPFDAIVAKPVAEGAFGAVFSVPKDAYFHPDQLATTGGDSAKVAVKVPYMVTLDRQPLSPEEVVMALAQEVVSQLICIWPKEERSMRLHCIAVSPCQKRTDIDSGSQFAMVFEYADNGSLFEFLKTTAARHVSTAIKYTHDIVVIGRELYMTITTKLGPLFKKPHTILHADMKLQNWVVDKHGNVMLADYGLAGPRVLPMGSLLMSCATELSTALRGTGGFIMNGDHATRQNDMHCMAVSAVLLCSGMSNPFVIIRMPMTADPITFEYKPPATLIAPTWDVYLWLRKYGKLRAVFCAMQKKLSAAHRNIILDIMEQILGMATSQDPLPAALLGLQTKLQNALKVTTSNADDCSSQSCLLTGQATRDRLQSWVCELLRRGDKGELTMKQILLSPFFTPCKAREDIDIMTEREMLGFKGGIDAFQLYLEDNMRKAKAEIFDMPSGGGQVNHASSPAKPVATPTKQPEKDQDEQADEEGFSPPKRFKADYLALQLERQKITGKEEHLEQPIAAQQTAQEANAPQTAAEDSTASDT